MSVKRIDNPEYMDVRRPERPSQGKGFKRADVKRQETAAYDRLSAQRALEKKFGKGRVSFGTR